MYSVPKFYEQGSRVNHLGQSAIEETISGAPTNRITCQISKITGALLFIKIRRCPFCLWLRYYVQQTEMESENKKQIFDENNFIIVKKMKSYIL